MNSSNLKLTSVEVDENLLQEFKLQCLRDRFSFQKLATRAIYLYLTDNDFRDKIRRQNSVESDNLSSVINHY